MDNWLAAAAAGVLAMFGAHGGGPTTTHEFKLEDGSSTHREMKEDMEHRGKDGHASSTSATVNIQCVSAAVAAREAALGSAETTFASGVSAAYSARATALSSAYAQSGNDAIKTAVKAAWKSFSNSTKGVKSAWQKSKENAWQTFRTSIKSCGNGASSISDANNSGSEMSGQ